MVDDFVINVNSSLKHKQDKERLKGIIARIESYDIVVSDCPLNKQFILLFQLLNNYRNLRMMT